MFSKTINNLSTGIDQVAQHRYGVIETRQGKFHRILLRPIPKLVSLPELWPVEPRYHARGPSDRCLLYYNQPWRMPKFIALKYLSATTGTSLGTVKAAIEVLNWLAELKRIDAIVCDAGNSRLSDRVMQHFGYESHKPQRWHRNYIRRFYGDFPEHKPWLPAV